MNADLEETLNELGPAYRDMVAGLRKPFEEEGRESVAAFVRRPSWRSPHCWLVAASVAVAFIAAAALFNAKAPVAENPRLAEGVYTIAYEPSPAAVDEMVRTQSPDGSWKNDYITRQNAAALKDVAQARVAYLKAVRYLRSRGLSPLTEGELRERAMLARSRRG